MPALARCLAVLSSLVVLLNSCAGRMNVTEKMMWSTYPLATRKGEATGFVVTRRDSRVAGGLVPVVFTSVHVLETVGSGPLVIGIRKPGKDNGVEVALLAFTPPKARGTQRFYVRHPRHDLAAFALHLPDEMAALGVLPSAIEESSLANAGRRLSAGDEVSFLGYPEVLPGTDGAFAVLRSGRIASYPVGTPSANGQFLVNSDVYPGDSGAPVFIARRGGRPEVVGMITRRVGADARTFSHLAVAVDANVIRETLGLLAESETQPVDLRGP
jgi:hypothetical protein